MKKWICLIAVLVLVFSLCACGAKDAAPAGSEAAAEDGQNPVMNFIGVYGHDRASIMVEADGMENAKITVTWGSSAAENAEWVMSGKFDPETLTVQYTDCVKTVYVWNEQGEIDSETVEYENGEGTITFTDGEALSLTWDDAQEHIADGTVFEYASLCRLTQSKREPRRGSLFFRFAAYGCHCEPVTDPLGTVLLGRDSNHSPPGVRMPRNRPRARLFYRFVCSCRRAMTKLMPAAMARAACMVSEP